MQPAVQHILNFVLYQLGWFALVLGAAAHKSWLGSSIAVGLLAIHFAFTTRRLLQWKLVVAAAAVGLSIDTIQLWSGVFRFPPGDYVEWLPPPWMTILWMQFATTLQYCMRWLSGRLITSACFGLVGAPLAFLAGERLGAIEFMPPRWSHYAILAALWTIALPLLVYISDRLAAGASRPAGYAIPGQYRPAATRRKTTRTLIILPPVDSTTYDTE